MSDPQAAKFTWFDEAQLRGYFAFALPAPPGASSMFPVWCRRLVARRRRTYELPTPGTPWTEIVEPRGRTGANRVATEDAMIAYVDATRRVGRTRRVLACLDPLDREVLAAQYGTAVPAGGPLAPVAAVAPLTPALIAENRRRASDGRYEPLEETVASLAALSVTAKRPGDRESATAKLATVRQEAKELLKAATSRYVAARTLGAER